MAIAVVATLIWLALARARLTIEAIGDHHHRLRSSAVAAGLYLARAVKMTAMPQLVSLFNAVGGGAAALVAIDDYFRVQARPRKPFPRRSSWCSVRRSARSRSRARSSPPASSRARSAASRSRCPAAGSRRSLLAAITVAGLIALVLLGDGGPLVLDATVKSLVLLVIVAAALMFGITMVLPIGGADMPVVIWLLNSFTGTAAAMAGFVINNPVLIIAGALVGASGAHPDQAHGRRHEPLDPEHHGRRLRWRRGSGRGEWPAAAARSARSAWTTRRSSWPTRRRSSSCRATASRSPRRSTRSASWPSCWRTRGVEVSYAIHPVAGRMPGHMNVLLAEANVPYPQLGRWRRSTPSSTRTDVALVVGANDVTNPAARRPGSPISGMPILDVDQARAIIVIKRSMGRGYAGIDNELYIEPQDRACSSPTRRRARLADGGRQGAVVSGSCGTTAPGRVAPLSWPSRPQPQGATSARRASLPRPRRRLPRQGVGTAHHDFLRHEITPHRGPGLPLDAPISSGIDAGPPPVASGHRSSRMRPAPGDGAH